VIRRADVCLARRNLLSEAPGSFLLSAALGAEAHLEVGLRFLQDGGLPLGSRDHTSFIKSFSLPFLQNAALCGIAPGGTGEISASDQIWNQGSSNGPHGIAANLRSGRSTRFRHLAVPLARPFHLRRRAAFVKVEVWLGV
jgi:hypothetical protein